MRIEQEQLESVLLEVFESERAGVFRRSRIPPGFNGARLGVDRNKWVGSKTMRFAYPLLPIAASLVLVFGLDYLGPSSATPQLLSDGSPTPRSVRDCDGVERAQYTLASFNACISGPGELVTSGECLCADLDKDGDVDLLDFGILQRSAPQMY